MSAELQPRGAWRRRGESAASGFLMALLLWVVFPLASVRANDAAILATIDDRPVTRADFERYVRSGWAGVDLGSVRTNPIVRARAVEGFLDLQVMAAQARREGIDRKLTFQKATELMEMKLLVQALTERDRGQFAGATDMEGHTQALSGMDRLREEVGLEPTPLATNDSPLVFTWVIETNAVLATLGGSPILEADFRWFLRDAFRPEQRPYVFSRQGARQELLRSYLGMRVLEAKARKDGMDQETAFLNRRAVMEDKLLAEFLQEQDQMMPWQITGSEVERAEERARYMDRLRKEVRLELRVADEGVEPRTGADAAGVGESGLSPRPVDMEQSEAR